MITSTMITSSNSSGMPNQVDGVLHHTMDESELYRVRTELEDLLISGDQ
jgi:hypothetical protein